MIELERFSGTIDGVLAVGHELIQSRILYYAGAYFFFKKAVNLLWDISHGLKSYVYPKIFGINYKEKYGEWAVITGCTQGIGKCYAEELAQKGMNIVLISRTQSKLEEAATELNRKYGVQTKVIVADFADPDVLPRIIEDLEKFNIDVGVLVNNVGMLGEHFMPFLELDEKTVIGMINVNILATTVLCHKLLPKMRAKGKGAVINLSSTAAYVFSPYLAVYTATKNYMSAFTVAIAEEYKGCGIEIQCVEPGAVKTRMTQYFDEKAQGMFYPTVENYTRYACRTLGFSRRTCGYPGHGFQLWLIPGLLNLKENTFVLSEGAKNGKNTYEKALLKKQKLN